MTHRSGKMALLAAALALAPASSPQIPASSNKESPPPADGWQLTADGSAASAAFDRGKAHAAKYEWEQALAAFEEAERIYQEAGDKENVARALNGIGNIHWNRGDYTEALETFGKSLRIKEEIGDKQGTAGSLNNIGGVHCSLGSYGKALEFFEKSLRMRDEIGDRHGVAGSLNNIGLIQEYLGNYGKALEFFEKSLSIKQKIGDKTGSLSSLHNIGVVYVYLGEYGKALEFYTACLRVMEEIGDKQGAAATLHNIGAVHKNLGDHEKALAFYEKSLSIEEEIGNLDGTAESLGALCNTRFGSPWERIPYGERALHIALEIDSPERIYEAHAALGTAFAAAAKEGAESAESAGGVPALSARPAPIALALQHFRSAIEVAESMRSLLGESEHKSGFLGTKLSAYEGLVELLIVSNSAESAEGAEGANEIAAPPALFAPSAPSAPSALPEAFAVAERMKARSFLDELGAAKFSRAGVPEELLQEKRLLEARIKWLRERQ